MAEPRQVAVIDIGKTNAKVAIFDLLSQQEIDRLTTPNAVVNSGHYPHYNIDGLWSFITSSLRELGTRHLIDAISVTTHGASAALLAQDGSLALPVLDYEHIGPDATAAQYDQFRPDFVETGTPRLPAGLNLGAQIFWQAKTFPNEFANVRWIVTYPQFWAWKLSGVLASEATSLGCHTDLWNYSVADYSTLVDAQGWRKLMPPLRKASDLLGPLLPEVAQETGLSPQTPIYCGIHDSNASLYPHLLAQQPPFSVVSTGTWVICMAIGAGQVSLDPARDTLVNVNALGQPVPSARFMGGREYQLLSGEFSGDPTVADEDSVLAHGAMLMPSVVEGCGPFPQLKMNWLNEEGLGTTQRQVVVSWYLALMTATCLQLVGAKGPIILEGPFAKNAAFVNMLLSATGQDVWPHDTSTTGTTLGAALLTTKSISPSSKPEQSRVPSARLRAYADLWNDHNARRR
jgi:sugar (pentulose or hexulose) kinase